MRLICLLLLILFIALPCAAREGCQLELKYAPAVLNLKLGATTAEARAAFGKILKIKNKTSGEYTFFQNFIKSEPPASLANIRALYLRFFDGRLYQIEIFYADEAAALTLDDFIKHQSARLNLPAEFWETEYGIARLDCGGFSLVADRFLNSRLELTDESVRAAVEAKREREKKN